MYPNMQNNMGGMGMMPPMQNSPQMGGQMGGQMGQMGG